MRHFLLFLLTVWLPHAFAASGPEEWIDPDTGHRVVRLSRLPGTSGCLYFHQSSYSQRGDLMLFGNTPPGGSRRLLTVSLATKETRVITERENKFAIVGARSRQVFYLSGEMICATDIESGRTRIITKIPAEWTTGRGFALNCDESVLVGCATIGEEQLHKEGRQKSEWFDAMFAAKLPSVLYSIIVKSGETKVFHNGHDWFGHVQFSPADPTLLMFCHEGPWDKLDRIWLIRTDGSGLRKLNERAEQTERIGHEFWSRDGSIIWYDQHFRRAGRKEFFLSGKDVETGSETRYPLKPEEWSLHFNISHDGKFFVGDGGVLGHPTDGKWIYLYRPEGGKLNVERLCNMARQDYSLEPNVSVTPDDRWVVFQANIQGDAQLYAVEVVKTAVSATAPPE